MMKIEVKNSPIIDKIYNQKTLLFVTHTRIYQCCLRNAHRDADMVVDSHYSPYWIDG
jgi:ribonuclease HIII